MPTINYLTRIEFDFGAIASLGAEIERMGLNRPLLVTDRGIADAGILQRAHWMPPHHHGRLSMTAPLRTQRSSRFWSVLKYGTRMAATG